MKLLICKLCRGEVDVIGNEHSIKKKTKCRKCGHSSEPTVREPEVVIIRRRPRDV